MTQLPLRFPLKQQFTLKRFHVGRNIELIGHLQDHGNIWMYSADAVGKTHLLQALCHETENAVYLPANRMSDSHLDLTGYDAFPLLLIDDVDWWLGHIEMEQKFFALFEAVQSQAGRMIIATSKGSPMQQSFVLKDLASRMRSFYCFEVMPLSESGYRDLFYEKAKTRGLLLNREVIDYMFIRVNRSHRNLLYLLDKIDSESLAQGREITIPFVRKVLDL